MSESVLEIKNLHAGIEGKEIINGLSLSIHRGEVHAVMGPNGAGKSTLSNVLMGHPKYEVFKGKVMFLGKNLLELEPDERAKAGLFLSFQYPFEVQGLAFTKFLHAAFKATHPKENISILQFRKELLKKLEELRMKEEFANRELNVGFSGGEKKRAEILQLMMLKPKLAILDETDSGLDIDSLKLVSEAINKLRGNEFSAMVITHYNRILKYLKPDFVHVLVEGKIVASGKQELADRLDEKGYRELLKELGVEEKVVVVEG